MTTLKTALNDMISALLIKGLSVDDLACQFYATQAIYQKAFDHGFADGEMYELAKYAIKVNSIIDQGINNEIVTKYLDGFVSKYIDTEPGFHQAAYLCLQEFLALNVKDEITQEEKDRISELIDIIIQFGDRVVVNHEYGRHDIDVTDLINGIAIEIFRGSLFVSLKYGGEVIIFSGCTDGTCICPLIFDGNYKAPHIPEYTDIYEMRYGYPVVEINNT